MVELENIKKDVEEYAKEKFPDNLELKWIRDNTIMHFSFAKSRRNVFYLQYSHGTCGQLELCLDHDLQRVAFFKGKFLEHLLEYVKKDENIRYHKGLLIYSTNDEAIKDIFLKHNFEIGTYWYNPNSENMVWTLLLAINQDVKEERENYSDENDDDYDW